MFRGRRILAVGAHPDDIEAGCFGTLSICEPEVLVCYVMSWGGAGDFTSGEERKKEALRSLNLLKLKLALVEPMTGLDPTMYHIYVKSVEKLVDEWNINLVLAPTTYDTHQDHRIAHMVVISALRDNKADFLFYDPHCRTVDFRPNLFVDISEVMHKKVKALVNHETQRDKYYMSEHFIRTYHQRYFGLRQGYHEAFEVGRIWISS